MNILILHDTIPADAPPQDADALDQVRAVSAAVEDLGHDAFTLPVSLDLDQLARKIRGVKPDLIFNLVESINGHGRLIHVVPSLLDALRTPYTGASAEAQFCTSNKLIAKRMLRSAYLPTPNWFTIDDLNQDASVAYDRYIIKSVWEHASIGLDDDSIIEAESPWQLREAIENRLDRLGGEGFAEQYIDGREFNLALLAGPDGPEVLPPAEILFEGYRADKPRIVGYRAKWDEQSHEYLHTPRRYTFPDDDQPLLDHLSSLAVDCWRLFGLRGYARVDFRVDVEGRPWILEINANPCLSPDAGYAATLDRAGIPFSQAIHRILSDVRATCTELRSA